MTLSVHLRHAFAGFDLDVEFQAPPGLTVLFGPSGSGKTTVVNAVAGLLRPGRGRIAAGDWLLMDTQAGHWLPPHRRRLGYVFQEGRLFPHLSVRQNLLYGRWFAPRDAPGDTNRESLERVVDILGIGPLLTRRPGALSGGEKQRVAIGRALMAAPKLILADEPLAALDEARKAEILPYFERLRDEVAVPILYVSHSSAEVARLATTVVALRAGRVVAAGPPEAVLGDTLAMGARAVASVLEARIVAHHGDGLSEVETPAGRLLLPLRTDAVGAALRLRIPAQEVILARGRPEGLSALNILAGVVEALEPDGDSALVVALRVGEARISARITRRAAGLLALAPGVPCHAIIKAMATEEAGAG